PVELPLSRRHGYDGCELPESGFCPSVIRMFERHRFRRTDAVALPDCEKRIVLLVSNVESSIVRFPLVVTSTAVCPPSVRDRGSKASTNLSVTAPDPLLERIRCPLPLRRTRPFAEPTSEKPDDPTVTSALRSMVMA